MCLAVPGKILEIEERDLTRMARVDFGGVVKDVCLEYLPDIEVGDYAIVHVGFAIQRLDEASAQETLTLFEGLGIMDEEFGDAWGRAAREAGAHRPDGTELAGTNGAGSETAGWAPEEWAPEEAPEGARRGEVSR
jgi:hydrogenase expression/formation protein HypC